MEDLGLDKELIDRIIAKNGSDIENVRKSERGKFDTERTTLQGQVTQRDTDLSALNEKLTAAQADASKLPEAQKPLTDFQSRYDTEKQEWAQKAVQQAYEYTVRDRANGLTFSSSAAKKEFIRGAVEKKFQVDGDSLLGFDDYVTTYKEADPDAFKAEPQKPKEPPKAKPDMCSRPPGSPVHRTIRALTSTSTAFGPSRRSNPMQGQK